MSIDGILCNVLMFKRKNRLPHELVVLLFEGHMGRVLRMFLCNRIYSKSAWHLKVEYERCSNMLFGEDYGTAQGTAMADYGAMVE
jgi:hypothetical protein